MPKQDHTPAVSLFSFQDIITSITGIMFLVVLLLLLFILEAEPEAAGREPREKLKEAAARVEELRRQLDLNRAADRELLRKIGEYRRNDPRLLQQRREELQRQPKRRKMNRRRRSWKRNWPDSGAIWRRRRNAGRNFGFS